MPCFTVVVVVYYNQPLRYKYSAVKTSSPEHDAGTKAIVRLQFLVDT